MTSDFGVTVGHVEYSNRRFDFDTRHMVMIEVYRHSAALDRFDYERPVYDRNDSYRARLFLTDEEYKAVRRMELNGVLRILHHANVVGGYLVDGKKSYLRRTENVTGTNCGYHSLHHWHCIDYKAHTGLEDHRKLENGGKQRPFHPIQDGLAHRQRCSHRRGHSSIHRGFEMKG